MSNYLELVNSAMQEAGVELDDLTSSNFANPTPTKMYSRFKRWVNKAWEDMQLENNEWEFESGEAVVSILPKILVSNGNRSTDPPSASTFESDSGDVTLTIDSVETLSGDWSLGTAEAFLSLSALDGTNNAILLETYNELTPSVGTAVFKFKYWGRYNLRTLVSDLEEANYEAMYLQDPDNGANRRLVFMPWAHWKDLYEMSSADARGTPIYFTETPEGYLDFFPRLDKEYTLTFPYTKATNTLVDYDDEPQGLDARYHDAIVWAAVMKYANYDKDKSLWATANKEWLKNMNSIDDDLGQKVTFGRSLF